MLFLLLLCTLLPAYAIDGAKFLDVTYDTMKGYWVSEMTDDDVKCALVIDIEATFFTQRYLCETKDGKKIGAIGSGSIFLTQQLTVKVDGQEFKVTFGFLSSNTVVPSNKETESDASAIGFALLEVEGEQLLIAFDAEKDDEEPTALLRLKSSAFEGVHKCENADKQKFMVAFRGPTWTLSAHDKTSDAYYAFTIGAFEAEGSKLNTFTILPVQEKPEGSTDLKCDGGKCVFTDPDGTKTSCTKVEESKDDLVGVWKAFDKTKAEVHYLIIDSGGVYYSNEFSVVPGVSEGASMVVGSYTFSKKDKVYTMKITATDLLEWTLAGGAEEGIEKFVGAAEFTLTMTSSSSFTSDGTTYNKVSAPKVAVLFIYLVPKGTTAKQVQDAVVAKTGGKTEDVVVVLRSKSTRSEQVEAQVSVAGSSADDVNKAKEISIGGTTVKATDSAKAESTQPPKKVATTTQTAVKKVEEKKSVSSLATFSMAVLVLCGLV